MADETTDIYQLVEDKREEMKPLFDRMDKDEDLYFLKPFVMESLPPNPKAIEEVANVTLPDPLLFTTKSVAIIGGATMQTVVKGKDMTDKQTTTIEQFLADMYYMVDEWLLRREIAGLDGFINEQICIRGRIGARCCVRLAGKGEEQGKLIPDVLPLDTRYFYPETDNRGMVWGAPEFRRSKTQILREYGHDAGEDLSEVVDFWDSEKNTVFVNKENVKTQPNTYKYPPFVYSICSVGSMFGTDKAVEHRGESILWPNRDLWPEMNRVATIMQTLNISALFGGLQLKSREGKAKPTESPFGPRKVNPVEAAGGYEAMPISDIKAATRLLYSMLESRLQRGSLSAIDYGTLSFPLSNIAITQLTGSRDDIFWPRVDAKAVFYQALSKMIISQCIAIGKTLVLGQPGSQNRYTANDLKGDYTITYRFFTASKEQAIADLSIASAARGFLPDDYIRREIMRVQDPDGMKVELLSEEAERTDEVLFLYRRASSLLEEKKGKQPSLKNQIEAYILARRMVTILEQRRSLGTPIEGKGGQKGAPQGKEAVPDLLGGAGGGGRGGGGQGGPAPETTEPEEVERG